MRLLCGRQLLLAAMSKRARTEGELPGSGSPGPEASDAVTESIAVFIDEKLREVATDLPKFEHNSLAEIREAVKQGSWVEDFFEALQEEHQLVVQTDEERASLSESFLNACTDAYNAVRLFRELECDSWVDARFANGKRARAACAGLSEALTERTDEWVFNVAWDLAAEVVGVAEEEGEEGEGEEDEPAAESDSEEESEEEEEGGSEESGSESGSD